MGYADPSFTLCAEVRVPALDRIEGRVDPIRADLQVRDNRTGKGEADGLVVHGSAGLWGAWICRESRSAVAGSTL
jgi:hypothetical protein